MFKRLFTTMLGMIWVMGLMAGGQTQAQTGCELINTQEQLHVYFAPVLADIQLKDILPKDAIYTMTNVANSFFLIEYGDGGYGWIDWHSRINGICPEFEEIYTDPAYDVPLSQFPTVCTYTIIEILSGYNDKDLTQPHGGFGTREPGTYVVVEITDDAIGLNGTASMSGGYVQANRGLLSGHCNGTLQLARALDNARVWTQPDAILGDVITTLAIDTEVGVLNTPVVGKIQADIDGDWYQVIQGNIIGWVWVERLVFGRTFTSPQPIVSQATVTENTRIWTQPDAKVGTVITTLFPNSQVNIIGDAIIGNIQLDTDLQGTWFPVQQGGTTGWVYEGRLNFISR